MTYVDSSIPMYLVGRDEAMKAAARRAVEGRLEGGGKLVTSAEAFREILHRYAAIGRRDAVAPAFEALLGIVDEVADVRLGDAAEAKSLLLGYPRLSARDALHVAVMRRLGTGEILSFDRGFDGIPGIARLGG